MNFATKRITSILFMSLFVFSTYANTGTEPGKRNKITESSKIEYSIYPIINSNKIRVAYQKSGKEKTTIKVYDAKKNLLFLDVQKNDTYVKRNYNLEKVGKGTYYIKIESGDLEVDQKVVIGKSEMNHFSSYLSPQLSDNKIRISYQHATSPVYITVLNSKGSSLFTKKVEDIQNFSSLFNLSSLEKGSYTVRVSSNSKVTEKTYSIQ